MLLRKLLTEASAGKTLDPFKRPKGATDYAVGVLGPNKDWSSSKRWREINRAVHSFKLDDQSFASMNQVVYGKPPLHTAGVNGCTVMAGELADGIHFLAHLDSFEVNAGGWVHLLIRGKGGDHRSPPYAGAKTLFVLCPDTREKGIRDHLLQWSKEHPNNPSYKLGLEYTSIAPYKYGDLPETHGYSVTYDGHELTATPETKQW